MYACMYVCMCVCVYACMHACMHACMYLRMYVCTPLSLSVYIYKTHISTERDRERQRETERDRERARYSQANGGVGGDSLVLKEFRRSSLSNLLDALEVLSQRARYGFIKECTLNQRFFLWALAMGPCWLQACEICREI